MNQLLMQKVTNAPKQPGCYIYKNSTQHIIYVGKSKNIHHRVSQYFRPSTIVDNPKLQRLVHSITDVEFMTTDTELNALILEYKLIKQYKPWFNSQFIRDSQHPLIRITMEDKYPAFYIVTKKESSKSIYMDCFSSQENAQEAIELMNAIWKIPACKKKSFEKRTNPCTRYHINRCLAPCNGEIDSSIYKETIKELIAFFKGGKTMVLSRLYKEMNNYSLHLNYEKATMIKQHIESLLYLQNKNKRMYHFSSKQEVLLLIRPYSSMEFSLFYIKNSCVMNRADFVDTFDEGLLSQFLIDIRINQTFINDAALLECLTEIIADKMYITLPIKNNLESIEKKLIKGYSEFMSTK